MWILKSLTISDSNNKTIVADWFYSQDEEVQAAFETRMKFLVGLPGDGWNRPYVGQLRRGCKGLFEIILKVENVQHRPIGYFSDKEEFTFIFFATERDGEFDPPNTCELAQRAKIIATLNKGRVREITI
jgi:hypothetical protein